MVASGRSFLEKSLIEACLEAFKTGAAVAAQDMGQLELPVLHRRWLLSGVGIELDLDKIPAWKVEWCLMNTCFLNPKSGCCLLPTKA